jgi:hypothetical protein
MRAERKQLAGNVLFCFMDLGSWFEPEKQLNYFQPGKQGILLA